MYRRPPPDYEQGIKELVAEAIRHELSPLEYAKSQKEKWNDIHLELAQKIKKKWNLTIYEQYVNELNKMLVADKYIRTNK